MKSLTVITLLLAGTALSSRANAFFWGYPMSGSDVTSAVDQQEHEQQHQGHKPPGNWKRPPEGHNHVGPHGEYRPHPGWHAGWHYDTGWHPHWTIGFNFPAFGFIATVPAGYWQCTAFNSDGAPVSDVGPTSDEAAYAALYSCGGPDYTASGCYIPPNYCRPR